MGLLKSKKIYTRSAPDHIRVTQKIVFRHRNQALVDMRLQIGSIEETICGQQTAIVAISRKFWRTQRSRRATYPNLGRHASQYDLRYKRYEVLLGNQPRWMG